MMPSTLMINSLNTTGHRYPLSKILNISIVMIDARDWNVDFFKKFGYTVYCTLEDYLNGYSKYKLQKRQ